MRKYLYYLSSIFELIIGITNWSLVVRTFLNLDTAPKKVIHLRQSGLNFSVRGKMDIWSVKEAFIDRFYEKYGCKVGDSWTVIDIGAGIGEFTLFAAAAHPKNRVLAFEPFAKSYGLLQENVAQNRVTNVQAIPEAVWSQTGSLLLDLSGGEPLQLQSVDGAQTQEKDGHRLVSSVSLGDVLDRLKIDQIDLLKLDCEGAEYPILFQAGTEVVARIQRIVMEYHDAVTQYTHADLEQFLSKQGFRVQVEQNPVHSDIGYLYAER